MSLYGIRIIRKYFTPVETRNMITAIFYSKLNYAAEVWHFQGLARILHKKLKHASANALKLSTLGVTAFNTHTEIHRMAERAMPEKMYLYRHAVMMFKVFNNMFCEN